MMEEADNLSISPAVPGEPKAVISKKKRNLPGMPDPDSEVIVLSPRALLATNRFICEICNKGFQRDQNLQLHRRGHNLPWKLRQRTDKEVRKRVYVCPEPTCVHHDPARALGDLTGIKKHFSRKHGEKKYRCDRCSKKYAVLSDLKAHVKTCGTREYRCDCGTLFSRRDSFITHRAFCDALAQETARTQPPTLAGDLNVQTMGPPAISTVSGSSTPPPTPTDVLSPVLSFQSSAMAASHLPETHTGNSTSPAILIVSPAGAATGSSRNSTTSGGVMSDHGGSVPPQSSFPSLRPIVDSPAARPTGDPISLTLSPSLYVSLPSFPSAHQNPHPHYFQSPSSPAVLSATALLQKAEQMGSTSSSSSNSSFLHSLRFPHSPISSTSVPPWVTASNADNPTHVPASCFNPSLFRQSAIYRDKQEGGSAATQDFLRLGTDGSYFRPIDISSKAFSGMRSGLGAWEDPSERKPSIL